MRIAVDATVLRPDRITGVERYTENLIAGLLALAPTHDWHILLRRGYETTWSNAGTATLHRAPYLDRLRRDQHWMLQVLRRLQPALVHFPAFPPPLRRLGPAKVVVTVHDATYWLHPWALSRGGRYYYRPLLSRALRGERCDLVLTDSHAGAADLLHCIGSATPIRPIHIGKHDAFRRTSVKPAARYGLDEYLLTVGTREPRKNLKTLFEAYRRFIDACPASPDLVVVGRAGWRSDEIPWEVRERIRFLEDVPDADLPSLYSHCAAFVIPSIYEGFGLPLLEAMACGAPCVAADIPVLREVGGSVCHYADPLDPDSLAAAIRRAIHSDDPGFSESRLIERAAHFSWENCARETLSAYDDVISGRVPCGSAVA